MVFSSDI